LKAKRLILSGIVTGLLVWGLSELYSWILSAISASENVSRIAPAFAGATLGVALSMIRIKLQQMRQKFLEEERIKQGIKND
jgi:hypothetical protein